MAVKLRLKRLGRVHRSIYRISAMESRNPRDGRVLEDLGTYDPANKDQSAQLSVNAERVRYWLSVGARPTETVASLLKKQGIPAQ
ncbi:MAG: 30S ribosomal protein S16 [Phycisphaerales bacterium]|nr:30S ribosomal protein S16 [Phycisphaerales bacterium]